MTDRLLLKILIGAAWLDGEIQPEERKYLQQVAESKGMAADEEIFPLLNGNKSISAAECDRLVQEYLQSHPDGGHDLLSAVSGLVYCDGEVTTSEAKLLNDLQSSPDRSSSFLLDRIRKIYRLGYEKLSR
jgi:hypothetical protein